ncbi:MAG TPA: choice-of-anchor D domain-containing protein, partial [Myxococcaceae bacterium]|nr:choice-of-anchor D domain-containing protein [Myxococcaceae bacterium]
MIARPFFAALVVALSLARCSCGPEIRTIHPTLGVSPSSLAFGKVKVGETAAKVIDLTAQTQADVTLGSATLGDGTAPGGASAFELVGVPANVRGLSTASFTVRFRPTVLQAYEARLTLPSNDPERPTVEVLISGEGAHPILEVTADCSASRGCRGTAVADPPSIDFGAEPIERAVEIPILELPRVTIRNLGEVTLRVTRMTLVGADASAFIPEGGINWQAARTLAPGNGVDLPIRFKPFEERAGAFNAELVIESDDPTHPEVRVPLTGTFRPNRPPLLCANIVSVKNPDVAARAYNAPSDWAPLLTPRA